MSDLNLKEYLNGLSKEELQDKWGKFLKTPPLAHLTKPYLIRQIAWCMEYKELPKETQKMMNKLVAQYAKTKTIRITEIKSKRKFEVKPGTKFIREYKGVKHEVIAVKNGYRYNGKLYGSLTAISIDITGTHWNGKRFFGVAK